MAKTQSRHCEPGLQSVIAMDPEFRLGRKRSLRRLLRRNRFTGLLAETDNRLKRGGRGLGLAVIALALLWGCRVVEAPTKPQTVAESPSLQRIRQVFARIPPTLERNYRSFDGPTGSVSGFGAGDAYPQIWLRDSSWAVDAAAAYYPHETLTSWLDLHLAMAEKGGRLRDWVAKGSANDFREWAPHVQERDGIAFDTNSNESDQEPSAALALCRAERILGPGAGADARARSTRISRVIAAMESLLRDRTDKRTGLIWSGLTADWGDLSPLYPDQRAIYLDAKTPRTLSLYSNVMVYAALDCLAAVAGPIATQEKFLARAARIRDQIRSTLWMKDQGFFRIRATLDREPEGFGDDGERFALGGNALAALFGVADDAQAASIFETAERLRVAQKLSTVSTTLIPPYAAGVFQHPAVRGPFQYQNGGAWDWFGAALVQAEFERGHSERARSHLDQIATRILKGGPGLHEWYGRDGSPQGSPSYLASGAAIYNAVVHGLLGVSRSSTGHRVVLRSGETLLPFEVRQRASSMSLVVSQTVTSAAIEVTVQGSAPMAEVCALLPVGKGAEGIALDRPAPQGVRQIHDDTIVCADVSSSPMPIRVRFALRE